MSRPTFPLKPQLLSPDSAGLPHVLISRSADIFETFFSNPEIEAVCWAPHLQANELSYLGELSRLAEQSYQNTGNTVDIQIPLAECDQMPIVDHLRAYIDIPPHAAMHSLTSKINQLQNTLIEHNSQIHHCSLGMRFNRRARPSLHTDPWDYTAFANLSPVGTPILNSAAAIFGGKALTHRTFSAAEMHGNLYELPGYSFSLWRGEDDEFVSQGRPLVHGWPTKSGPRRVTILLSGSQRIL
jgi:hypothetical protein